jgi:A/G-specific adenine glycosylase
MRRDRARAAVLAWYRPRRHAYAWRRGRRDPYRTLVSEVMLQQTQAARVEPAFEAFVRRFPDVVALAEGSRADVLRAWDGLGYNRRAVALHEAARAVVRDHGGRIPSDPVALRRLPGVGPYTAAAVASIGFGLPVAAADTNALRILARVVHGLGPAEVDTRTLAADAEVWLDRSAPGDWNQALMDLGRTVCRPAPRCGTCPLATVCRFARIGGVTHPAPRRQGRFEGSERQLRGAIVAALRRGRSLAASELASRCGSGEPRVVTALRRLHEEGLVEPTRTGRWRLPR